MPCYLPKNCPISRRDTLRIRQPTCHKLVLPASVDETDMPVGTWMTKLLPNRSICRLHTSRDLDVAKVDTCEIPTNYLHLPLLRPPSSAMDSCIHTHAHMSTRTHARTHAHMHARTHASSSANSLALAYNLIHSYNAQLSMQFHTVGTDRLYGNEMNIFILIHFKTRVQRDHQFIYQSAYS